jgi:mRNA export factor
MQKDFELASPPSDGISSLSWSPTENYLSVSSWDNNTRIYQVQPNGSSQGKAMIPHDAPALCTAWSKVIAIYL